MNLVGPAASSVETDVSSGLHAAAADSSEESGSVLVDPDLREPAAGDGDIRNAVKRMTPL